MRLHVLENRNKAGYTTWGCFWEKGSVDKDMDYRLLSGGEEIPMQWRITAYWPDGSVKWTAHTADARRLQDEIEVLPVGKGAEDVLSGKTENVRHKSEDVIHIVEQKTEMEINAGTLHITIPQDGRHLFGEVCADGRIVLTDGELRLMLEQPVEVEGCSGRVIRNYVSHIEETVLEEKGPLHVTVRFTGCHIDERGDKKFPFIVRMKIGMNSSRIAFMHTFLYDGEEDRDYLKGIGIACKTPMTGPVYDRHVKFTADHGTFHESVVQLVSWHPQMPEPIYAAQMRGEKLELSGEDAATVDIVLGQIPEWNEFTMTQTDEHSFSIRKKLKDDNCCYLDCLHGVRTKGGAALGSHNGSVMFAIRDFWEKYPSGYTFRDLQEDQAEAVLWFWSPEAQAMDFRHYANRGYSQSYYEGYDYKGATPYGIACTSECAIGFADGIIPADETLEHFTSCINSPALYVGEPQYYHDLRAFGYWSLPKKDSEMERWTEEQLDRAFAFYEQEVNRRNWYGMFNYGDFMHTYDKERHNWRYDIGGYAWDNTELVPTLWLWYAFLRTGREDIFRLAANLSRHASEVDVYHFGKYKGLGSRHNVRHWGCPCKEARIAMAGHHRFYYYLTGDFRMEDIFAELKDNEMTFLDRDPLGDFYEKDDMVYPSHARSGPDWSSLCSNWMTWWEMTGETVYRDKILKGMADIKNAPLKLISGPDFEFDPETVSLRYIGERTTGGTHLQICMGASQIWAEMADLLEDEEWKKMMADYGRFYFLPHKQQLEESGGLIGDREFSLPFMASGMAAYSAGYNRDTWLARRTWSILLGALAENASHGGFEQIIVRDAGNQKELVEIPWISTNFTAQWCLNVIMALDFIRNELPKDWKETEALLRESPEGVYHRA